MIPLCCITGFLGSGKTTLMRRLVARFRGRRIVFFVNEFSSVDVDGHLVGESSDVVSIPGGSIFCKCLVSEFIRHLSEIPSRFGAQDSPVEGVIIEASGMADPRVIQAMLKETKLDALYSLDSIIAVADPATFPKLLQVLPNIRAQTEAADRVLINKCDLHEEPAICETEQLVRKLAPRAVVHRCIHADVAFSPFGAAQAPSLNMKGTYAQCRDPRYRSVHVPLKTSISSDALRSALHALEPYLYRAKGFLSVDQKMRYVDYSGGALRISDITETPPAETRGLVTILAGECTANVDRIFQEAALTA